MDKNIELKICLGSSCYARGNGRLVQELQDWKDVRVCGTHCQGRCAHGPNVQVGEVWHAPGNAEALRKILETELVVRAKKVR